MDPKIIAELQNEQMTEFHSTLLNHCRTRVDSSRAKMGEYYTQWEERHRVYKSTRTPDKQDAKAREEGRPPKQVLPLSYAKVNTFVSFIMSLFTQRPDIFELEPTGGEDKEYRELAERVLRYDTLACQFRRHMRQAVKDVAKFGLGILKHTWEEQYVYVPESVEQTRTIFGIPFKLKPLTTIKKHLKRKGNRVRAICPFDFFPDPRFPLTELQRGEFCADECDYSRSELSQMEAEGVVSGVKHVQNFDMDGAYRYGKSMRRSKYNFDNPDQNADIVRLTEIQIKITPANFMLSDGTPMGTEKVPRMFLVWMVNCNRIVRCEPMGHLHGEFTYDVAQYDEDSHEFAGQSLSDLLERLQDTADWFVNARVESVTRTIDNQLVVDPLGVEMSTITNRSRVILLKKGAARTGVDRYVKQLAVQDVTGRHMDDVNQLMTLMQVVTGVNENAMGQYHTGRRSATEARVVTQGAASRLKEIGASIWDAMIEPNGRKRLLNLRQGLEALDIIRIAGQEYSAEEKQLAVSLFMSSVEELVACNDFFVYDGTLASEKAYLAQTLKELFETVINLGAQGLVQLDISPKLILESVYALLGVGTLQEFALTKDPQTLMNVVNTIVQQQLAQYVQQLSGNPGAIGAGDSSTAK